MRRHARRVLVLMAVTVATLGCAAKRAPGPAPAARRQVGHVIVVSVDGLLPETYLHPDAHQLAVPTLRELARTGAVSEGARSVYPASTYPAHATIVTGVSPARHGVVSNLVWDPEERAPETLRTRAAEVRAPTLWDAAASAGLRTALIDWPATAGATATVLVPDRAWPESEDPAQTLATLTAESTPGLLAAVTTRFPGFPAACTPKLSDRARTDIAVHVLETTKPELLLLHLGDVDERQHEDGLWSPPVARAIETADAQLARVIDAARQAGTWDDTLLVVLSDHGFTAVSQRVRPGLLLRDHGLVTLDAAGHPTSWRAAVAGSGGQAYLYLHDPADATTRAALTALFTPLAGAPRSGLLRVLQPPDIAALGGDPAAALALEAADGFSIARGYTGEYVFPAPVKAHHGFDPARPDMHAALLIGGPRVQAGGLTGARLLDVGPTVAWLLGLPLPEAEGRTLPLSLRTE